MSDARIVPARIITKCDDCPECWLIDEATTCECALLDRLVNPDTIPDDCPLERAKEAHDD